MVIYDDDKKLTQSQIDRLINQYNCQKDECDSCNECRVSMRKVLKRSESCWTKYQQ